MGLKIVVEIERWHFKTSSDDEMVQTRVMVDGKPEIYLTKLWTRDDFHSYFDNIWEYMGKEIKKMAVEIDFIQEEKESDDGS